tara:strand:+ start:5893 stop:6498 length:606 start_codon:yes stop_codon:yes gene_type:complete
MGKSLIINLDILDKYNITIDELLCIFKKKQFNDYSIIYHEIADSLEHKNLIKIEKEDIEGIEFSLRQKAIDILNNLTIEVDININNKLIVSKSSRKINQELEENVEVFRNKWKGLKMGSMGSPKACKEKLKRWMKENPSYSIEQILKAADAYINSLNDFTYLQQADYFIFKKDGKEESSRLSAFIDEVDNYKQEGWTSNLK